MERGSICKAPALHALVGDIGGSDERGEEEGEEDAAAAAAAAAWNAPALRKGGGVDRGERGAK